MHSSDMKLVALVLAHATQDDVNALVNKEEGSTPLHLASSAGNLAMVQMLIWVSNFKYPDCESRFTHPRKSNDLSLIFTVQRRRESSW